MVHQAEEYIKKRIEHLEMLRDQAEFLTQIRLAKQTQQKPLNIKISEQKPQKRLVAAAIKIQAFFRGYLVRKKINFLTQESKTRTQCPKFQTRLDLAAAKKIRGGFTRLK